MMGLVRLLFWILSTLVVVSIIIVDARAPLIKVSQLPLKTKGRWIVDRNDTRVKFSCVNWSGAAQKDGVVGGLQHQRVQDIASTFADMGFNCVRMPFSVEMVHRNWTVNETLLSANPDLVERSTLQIMDAVVSACSRAKLMIVLDNHMSDADWCCSETDENGLWYNDRWSENDWIEAHRLVARRYADAPYVVAIELRNELRASVVGGRTVSPTWFVGNNLTDWRTAAVRAADEILSVRSSLLIVVDSLSYSTDFTDVRSAPIVLGTSRRLVYSAHDYSWSQKVSSESDLHKYLESRWGYLAQSDKAWTAPVWLSEFGTWHDGRDMSSGWWPWFLNYLKLNDFDFGYWRGDGTESRGTGRTFGAPAGFGVLNTTWNGPAENGTLLKALKPLQSPTQGPGYG